MGSSGTSRHLGAYRALIRLYPRSFRAEYAEPMAQLFGDRLRDVGAKAWLRTVPDLLRTITSQRIEATMSRLSHPTVRIVTVALLTTGAVAGAIGIGGRAVFLIFGVMLVLVFGQWALFSSAAGSDHAPMRQAFTQAWWAPVAALLGVATILFGVGTIFEAHNVGGMVVGSSVLMMFGASMLWGLMRRPFARAGGNTLVLLGTIPALVFFWVVVPTVIALVIWIGVISSGFGDKPAPVAP